MLDEFPSLSPRTDVFTHDDGRSQLLLRLTGTVPMIFLGTMYHIPTDFWIPRAYPQEPPIIYVVPTQGMAVRRSECVEPSGRVWPAYTHEWQKKPEAGDLSVLVRACQELFGIEPPVCAIVPRKIPTPESSAPARPPKPVTPSTPPKEPAKPPARPLNPEVHALHERIHARVTARLGALESSLSKSNAELETLYADLERGDSSIRDEMQRLAAVRDVCNTSAERYAELNDQAHTRAAVLRSREIDPDSALVATSIAESQLVDLVAEDQALGDAIYQISRAFTAERIPLDRLLKHTRELAREQFLCRALARKITDGLGWSM